MDANYVCLFCHASYHRDRHHCIEECCVAGKRVIHFDICFRCARTLLVSFSRMLVGRRS